MTKAKSKGRTLEREFTQDFGEAYQHFGLPRLMGRIVGLLLQEDEPVSLDDIASRLRVSKGPVSQVIRRLHDRGLVEKVCVPGDRRHFYEATDDIFGRAFTTHTKKLESNLLLARRFVERTAKDPEATSPHFRSRLAEMERFYGMMSKHLNAFLAEWRESRS
ncbi:MAG: MarR family transcriptional regulator [Candidatus Eisenbacteria bacterium]